MKGLSLFLKLLVQTIAGCVALSGILFLGQWLLSLLGVCNAPTWRTFLWGALVLFAVYIIIFVVKFIKTFSHKPSAISEYYAVNGRDYYAELRGDDKIGRIDAPGFRQTYDRIIVGIAREITSSEDDMMRFGKLLYSKNFYPISCHTKKEIMQHINTVIEETASSSNDGDAIREKARNRIEFLFNAYVSVMSIHEEATTQINESK